MGHEEGRGKPTQVSRKISCMSVLKNKCHAGSGGETARCDGNDVVPYGRGGDYD